MGVGTTSYATYQHRQRLAARSTTTVNERCLPSIWTVLWTLFGFIVIGMFVTHAMLCQQSARAKELSDHNAELILQVRRDEDQWARLINPQRIAEEAARYHMVEMDPPVRIPAASEPVRTASAN